MVVTITIAAVAAATAVIVATTALVLCTTVVAVITELATTINNFRVRTAHLRAIISIEHPEFSGCFLLIC